MKDRINIKVPIINQIEEIVKNIPGWTPIDQLYTLFNMAYLISDLEGDIVEIGSWCGRSTAVLGTVARMIGSTKVYAIDLFPKKTDWKQNDDGSYSLSTQIGNEIYNSYKENTVWKDPFEKDMAPVYENYADSFDAFMVTILMNNLQDIVKPYKGNSAKFASSIGDNFKCKLVFLDGDHSYNAIYQDIQNLDKFLVEGGWLCFDDAFSCFDGVNRAIEELIINNSSYDLCQQMTRKLFVARKKGK
jgi:Methyltransferase domain